MTQIQIQQETLTITNGMNERPCGAARIKSDSCSSLSTRDAKKAITSKSDVKKRKINVAILIANAVRIRLCGSSFLCSTLARD